MVEVGKDLKIPRPTCLVKHGQPEQEAQVCVQLGFECLYRFGASETHITATVVSSLQNF